MHRHLLSILVLAMLSVGCKESGDKTAPSTKATWNEARARHAKALVDNFAHNAYALWAVNNSDKPCPESLEPLAALIDKKATDPAGAPLVMLCGEDAPAEARGFGVLSVGADGKRGTGDDITSWSALP